MWVLAHLTTEQVDDVKTNFLITKNIILVKWYLDDWTLYISNLLCSKYVGILGPLSHLY